MALAVATFEDVLAVEPSARPERFGSHMATLADLHQRGLRVPEAFVLSGDGDDDAAGGTSAEHISSVEAAVASLPAGSPLRVVWSVTSPDASIGALVDLPDGELDVDHMAHVAAALTGRHVPEVRDHLDDKVAEALSFFDVGSVEDLDPEMQGVLAERLTARFEGVTRHPFMRTRAELVAQVAIAVATRQRRPVVVRVDAEHHGRFVKICSRDERSGEPVPGMPEVLRQMEIEHRDAAYVELVELDDGPVYVGGSRLELHGGAAVRVAHDLTDDADIELTREEALQRITADDLERILHDTFDDADRTVLTTALAASPGAAVGEVVLSAAAAEAAAAQGRRVILVRQETSPEDVHGMEAAAGIVTTRGGLASHAAVVARGWGTPAVCGAEAIDLRDDHFVVGDFRVAEGDTISIDGSTGEVILGALEVTSNERPPEFDVLLGWADDVRSGHLGVRANADTAADAAVGRGFGAEGIGLCRTEHMFLGEDRLPIVRQMILADTPAKERMALTRLRMAQRDDFVEILEAMDGLPVTVRLLDPPLHEFLPPLEELIVRSATLGLSDEDEELLRAAREWHELNPMIGTRGVRLGYLKPGLYSMQVTALMEAVAERVVAGGTPVVEIMIPLTVSAPELAGARAWVDEVLENEGAEGAVVTVGTMVETPRAALQAGEIAEHADFFSFGTNDLTQLTFGFSRDDVEGRIMGLYLDRDLLDGNPFDSLDVGGVGELVQLGAERGRAAKPELKLGVCGEHGGDPASIQAFHQVGVDYVSCSPYRVPVARLAAAQAVLAAREDR